jgi:hypothetical protein
MVPLLHLHQPRSPGCRVWGPGREVAARGHRSGGVRHRSRGLPPPSSHSSPLGGRRKKGQAMVVGAGRDGPQDRAKPRAARPRSRSSVRGGCPCFWQVRSSIEPLIKDEGILLYYIQLYLVKRELFWWDFALRRTLYFAFLSLSLYNSQC